MSAVKKLSLSGFKSTFKRKTTRNNPAIGVQETKMSLASDIRSAEDYRQCKNGSASKYMPGSELPPGIIHENDSKIDIKGVEGKISRWKLLSKFDRNKSCDNAKINDMNVDSAKSKANGGPPGSELDKDNRREHWTGRSPHDDAITSNHMQYRSRTGNDYDRDYIGTGRSMSTHQASHCHSFHAVENSCHPYINGDLKTCGSSLSYDREKTKSERGSPNIPGNMPNPKTHHRHSLETDSSQVTCDMNDNPEIHEESMNDCQSADGTNGGLDPGSLYNNLHEDDDPDDLPPAIPPKPATLFINGQWTINRRMAQNEDGAAGDVHEPPPRPPARSKTKCVVDLSLPFYKHYLEKESFCQPAPVYEDVKVDFDRKSGGLAGELSKLPRQPWYWGPMLQDEAEEKLADTADGSFLVRDSSDQRYLLTLSFKSNGRPFHIRIEHRNGLFSLSDSEGYASVVELIHSAVSQSQKGVFGYMNDLSGTQNFMYPARLTQWVSRYSEVKSLQYLCRFVIRETFPRHHIRRLPLPAKINEYILENQY